jgi:predicted dehydrogenase
MRVGVIGRGFGERVSAPAFASIDGCEVVDVVSPRDGAAVAALCGRDDVDMVAVHSPPFLHADHVRLAVAAGHAVLCDKPFGRSAAEAAAMRDAAVAAGVAHFLNFEHRYDAARVTLLRAVADGDIGEPEHVTLSMLMSLSRTPVAPYRWLHDASLGGGWLRALGSHYIDFVRSTFGEIVEASGQLRTVITERPDADGQPQACTADDGFVVVLRTERGVTAVLDSSSVAPVDLPPSLRVLGSTGVVEEGWNRVTVRAGGEERELYAAAPDVNALAASQRAYAQALVDAVTIGDRAPDVATFDDGVACNEVMDRIAPVGA